MTEGEGSTAVGVEYRSFHRCYCAASIGGQKGGARNSTEYDIAQSISEKIGSDL